MLDKVHVLHDLLTILETGVLQIARCTLSEMSRLLHLTFHFSFSYLRQFVYYIN